MSEYTPTTEKVVKSYQYGAGPLPTYYTPEFRKVLVERRVEFDRWLERVEQAAYEHGLAERDAEFRMATGYMDQRDAAIKRAEAAEAALAAVRELVDDRSRQMFVTQNHGFYSKTDYSSPLVRVSDLRAILSEQGAGR